MTDSTITSEMVAVNHSAILLIDERKHRNHKLFGHSQMNINGIFQTVSFKLKLPCQIFQIIRVKLLSRISTILQIRSPRTAMESDVWTTASAMSQA